ncbi:hypothetical protein AAF712_000953 [Marasmius tenuissimus]|uniref:Uncharacterized protein n=1 Tax=Marasmius tenuissimus TaxID=585030 RepID=A0ABR3ADN9_9AGAR
MIGPPDSGSMIQAQQIQSPCVLSISPGNQMGIGAEIPTISIPALPAYRTMGEEHQESPSLMADKTSELLTGRVLEGPVESRRIAKRQDSTSGTTRTSVSHPYARLLAKKDSDAKRRKIWNHALEKHIFSPYELSTLGAPHRRTIYLSSLEAHIDRLHDQLLSCGLWPVAFDELEPFKGLNSKTAKSMVAGRQHEASLARLKLLELQRANENLEKELLQLEYASPKGLQPNGMY